MVVSRQLKIGYRKAGIFHRESNLCHSENNPCHSGPELVEWGRIAIFCSKRHSLTPLVKML